MTNKTDAKFTRAWLNIDSLPGTMMEGTGGRFGPVPGFTSCVVTTSERNVEDWKQRGVKFIEVFTAPPAASVDVVKLRGWLERIKAAGQSAGNDGRPLHEDTATIIGTASLALEMIDSAGGAKGEWRCACGDVNAANETCGLCHQSTPQPDGGDGAVAEVIDALGTGVLIPQWIGTAPAPVLPIGTRLYTRPSAAGGD